MDNISKFILAKNSNLELDINPNSYKLLNILITYSNRERKCFPSVRTICKKYKMSSRTVSRALIELEEKKIIKRNNRVLGTGKVTSNEYEIYEEYFVMPKVNDIKDLIARIEEKCGPNMGNKEFFDYDWLNEEKELYDD